MPVPHRYSTAFLLFGLCSLACDDSGGPTGTPVDPAFLLAPRAPSSTKAVAVAYDRIRVSWLDNSTNENGFQVYRSTTGATGTFSLRVTHGANVTAFGDTRVEPSKAYCYKVRSFRTLDGMTSYSAFSNVACATTPPSPLPAAPSAAASIPVSSTAVRTTWTDRSSNEDGFRVQRSTDAGATWTTAVTVGVNITAYRDNGRTTDRPVCYRVIAFNEHGSSAPSNVDCTSPPAKPTNLAASVTAQAGVNLTWADNSRVEDGYQVQRSTDGTTYSSLANLAANATSYADAGATSNTKYWYRVRAKKDGGFSEFSNIVNATAGGSPGLAAPSGTTAKPVSSTSVLITWVYTSWRGVGFRVQRSSDAGSTWTTVSTSYSADGTLAAGDAGRPTEQQVCYRVIAFNDQGESPPSNTDCTAPPAAPTGLSTTTVDGPAVDLRWTDNSSLEDGYEVLRASGGSSTSIAQLPANTTSYRDITVGSDRTYEYMVRATKDGGHSGSSNLVTVATPATFLPNAPSDVRALPNSSNETFVSWRDNSTNEDGFRVERSTDGGANWVQASTTRFSAMFDGGRTSEQQVCYRVTAFNTLGTSATSNTVCTVPPRGPSSLSIRRVDQQTFEFLWPDESAFEDGYAVWYEDDWEPGARYLLAQRPANSTSYTETGWLVTWCMTEAVCTFYVAATKDGGYSDLSPGATVP